MDNWSNNDNWSNSPNQTPVEGGMGKETSTIGYEGGSMNTYENTTTGSTSDAASDGRRNYEKYMAGETWTPDNNTQMQAGGYESSSSYSNQYDNSYTNSYTNSYSPANSVQSFAGLEEPVSVGEWIISILLMMIPCVNIILMFVWAFGSSEKKSKSNYFKASLILAGVMLALYLIIFVFAIILGVTMSGF